jgi:hypothetical protein
VREFDKPIGRVWRRLRFQRFLGALVWCLGACLVLTAVAIAVEKFANRPIPGADWIPFAVAGGVGVLIAAGIALVSGASRVDAAVAIDRAFHLNERLSTTLTLPVDLRETPAGRALMADTLKHINDLDIGAKFGLRMPRAAWVPLVPAALALGLLMVPEWTQNRARAKTSTTSPEERAKIALKAKTLGKSIAEKRKELDKGQFAATEKLLAEIEKAADKLSKAPPAEKDKAMVELNKLTDALKDRQKQLGSTEQISKQLQQLKELSMKGPADDFAKELARGDFAKAAEQLKKLQEKLASGKMTEKEKKELRDQLGKMKEQLEKLANLEQRKKQLEQAYKNGGLTKEQFDQQMSKLNEQSKDLKKLAQMAQQLGKAGEQLTKNDLKKAAEALGMSQKELEQMAKAASELETLDQAMAELQDAKNGMAGDGMNQIGEQLEAMNALGDSMRRGNGFGTGRGRGQGDRPEAADNTNTYSTKVKQQYTKGKVVVEGFAPPSKQMKGDSVIVDEQFIQTAPGLAAEALTNQKVPKSIEKHVKNYFDQVRKGN